MIVEEARKRSGHILDGQCERTAPTPGVALRGQRRAVPCVGSDQCRSPAGGVGVRRGPGVLQALKPFPATRAGAFRVQGDSRASRSLGDVCARATQFLNLRGDRVRARAARISCATTFSEAPTPQLLPSRNGLLSDPAPAALLCHPLLPAPTHPAPATAVCTTACRLSQSLALHPSYLQSHNAHRLENPGGLPAPDRCHGCGERQQHGLQEDRLLLRPGRHLRLDRRPVPHRKAHGQRPQEGSRGRGPRDAAGQDEERQQHAPQAQGEARRRARHPDRPRPEVALEEAQPRPAEAQARTPDPVVAGQQ